MLTHKESTKEAYLFASGANTIADLYVARLDRNGNILPPELLGPAINTPYSERTHSSPGHEDIVLLF